MGNGVGSEQQRRSTTVRRGVTREDTNDQPTGKTFRVPVIAVFFFDDDRIDRIVKERVYFDSASLVTQIGRAELLG